MLSFLRDSEEGKIEERKPMFGFRFPQWFADKYPSKMAAFRTNAKERLVTPFDIHATLHHLLDIEKNKYELPHFKKERVRHSDSGQLENWTNMFHCPMSSGANE